MEAAIPSSSPAGPAPERVRVSIAMCTFNGAAHLHEQLQSIAKQTRRPDELVVCDDGSSDETVAMLRAFSSTAPFPVALVVNAARLGFAANFEKAIGLCTGEVIFCSDQDDSWKPSKIERFLEAFRSSPGTGLILCDANLVDSQLAPLGTTWWRAQRFGRRARAQAQTRKGGGVFLKNPAWIAAGATMAFSAPLRTVALPVPAGWTHDAWIATVVSALTDVRLIPEALNDYRQHETQVYGAGTDAGRSIQQALSRGATQKHFTDTIDRYRVLRQRLDECGMRPRDDGYLSSIDGKIAHWSARAAMRQRSRWAGASMMIGELLGGRYHRYSQSWRSLAMDVMSVLVRR
jgi:glycosyltransferase involved in cell wall biosynthesis